jgi:hypothetical protein
MWGGDTRPHAGSLRRTSVLLNLNRTPPTTEPVFYKTDVKGISN